MSLPHKKNFLRDVLPKGSPERHIQPKKIAEEPEIKYQKIEYQNF